MLLPTGVLADGGFIPATAFERVRIPDQRALIHFAHGRETLVIDTAFQGDGTNFAWLIPVPSVPTVEPATAGLFSTLQTIFSPRVVHEVFGYYWWAILAGLILAYIAWKGRRGQSPIAGLMVVAILAIFSSMLLPALGPAGVASSNAEVSVIGRKRVGVYDTATLSSRDGQAVFAWLNQNGFAAPTNFIPAIRAYAQEGWCFVASRIRLDAALPEGAKAHPLALTFKTERPVYPLRLTGINNESCRIDLYVFGPSRAEVPHFRVERCGAPSYPNPLAPGRSVLEGLRIRHPLLRKLVAGSPAATKLVGRLTSGQMREDGYLTWTPLKEKRLTRYSRKGAAIIAANFSVPVLMVGLLALLGSYWASEKEPAWARKSYRLSGALILAALVCWGMIWVCLPKTQVVASRRPALRMRSLHQFIPTELERLRAKPGGGEGTRQKPDAAWVRQQLAGTSDFRRGLESRMQTNWLTGELWREEDSPGNYLIRETGAGLEYLWYDLEGGENVVPLFREKEAK